MRIAYKDIVELGWRGKHGRIEIHAKDALLIVPIAAFTIADQLTIVKIFRRRVQEIVQTDWPIFCRDTAISMYHLANGRLATGESHPTPKPAPVYAKVNISREESIASTWRACRVVNCLMLYTIPLVIVEYIAKNGIVGIKWQLLLAVSTIFACALTFIVWSTGAVFCMLTPKAGRTIRRKVGEEPRKKEAMRLSISAGELLLLVLPSLVVASTVAWGFYQVFHSCIGFLQTESAYACVFVFLIAYVGCAVVWGLIASDSKMTTIKAAELWAHEVM